MKKKIFLIRPHDCPEQGEIPAEDLPLRRIAASEIPESSRIQFNLKTASPPGPRDDESAARKIWFEAGHF